MSGWLFNEPPPASAVGRPRMTGYPLSPAEQAAVDRYADKLEAHRAGREARRRAFHAEALRAPQAGDQAEAVWAVVARVIPAVVALVLGALMPNPPVWAWLVFALLLAPAVTSSFAALHRAVHEPTTSLHGGRVSVPKGSGLGADYDHLVNRYVTGEIDTIEFQLLAERVARPTAREAT